jgi:hypothetical protein
LGLGAFQRDLLRQHDVSNRQIAHRQKTQSERRTAVVIDLADVRRGARIDPVPLAGVAADSSRRDRPSAIFSMPCRMKRRFAALLRERSPRRDGLKRSMAPPDQPPTSLGKNTVSSVLGSNDRIRET